MSSSAAFARPIKHPEHNDPLRHVEIVTTRAQRKTRPRVAYALIAVASLFVIFAAQLVLSIVVSEGAYQIASLQGQQKDLTRTQKSLSEDLGLLGSPQNLAANAASLGMAPNPTPLQLDLATGAVTGAPGSIDRFGCGGGCNLVANELLVGRPLVTPVAPSTLPAAIPPAVPNPTVVDSLPAPVTH
jgi:hypothetical protein